MTITETLQKEFSVNSRNTENIINMLDEGNTIPFIARYRKELTGGIDDQVLRDFSDRLNYLRNLEKKKQDYTSSIEEQGKLTDEIRAEILAADTLAELEDIYRPFKQKRRTRAIIAKEKGLEGLATAILLQQPGSDPEKLATGYIDTEKGVENVEDALAGASDIIAEIMSDSPEIRKDIKDLIISKAVISSTAKTEAETVYEKYYAFSEAVSKIPPHRILAINRGEKENILKVSVDIDNNELLKVFYKHFVFSEGLCAQFIKNTAEDSLKRLVFPSVENEIRNDLTEKASEQAIKMFGENLKPLLLQPPVKGKTVLALDPGYRMGCKLAVINPNGKVLWTGLIYPTPPFNKKEESAEIVKKLIRKYGVDCISIGNGTASKESEIFVADTIREFDGKVTYMVVNEAGASVYSASKLGAQEFPDFDVNVRSAVSIGRRLQDPLAELVKIEPKAIGVGQYQHDVPQARLEETLDGVVEGCVNSVGVDLNTASPSLLKFVAGITSSTAANIVAWRNDNGAFESRTQLRKVKGLGPKAFEQCAGFLRIPGGKEILDNTGVHPESYSAAKQIMDKIGTGSEIGKRADSYGRKKLADEVGIGLPTLNDIIVEIAKPGRDIRDSLPAPQLRSDILSLEDLREGMVIKGTVRNVIDFGAFVDIGVHQDGLVHISEIANRYIRHPSEVLTVGDVLDVKVIGVDVKKHKISLSIKQLGK